MRNCMDNHIKKRMKRRMEKRMEKRIGNCREKERVSTSFHNPQISIRKKISRGHLREQMTSICVFIPFHGIIEYT